MTANLARLSARERQVAALVKDGLSDREVAEKLHLSKRTAEWHVEQILAKLDLRSRAQLAAAIAAAEARGEALSTIHVPQDLPLQQSAFIGRKRELTQLTEALHKSRLITLLGTAGVGKTRLALEIASRSVDAFPAGVWFVDLAAVKEGPAVLRTIAAALHVIELSDRPLSESLVERIRDQRLLLLLDNCEHLIEESARMAELLLRSCPATTVLATSRESLRIPGETVWPVSPLAAPDSRARYTLEELGAVEAVDLFLDRAQHVAPGLQLTAELAPVVSELCRRLDGLPLGIELAAARARMMSPREMLDQMLGPSGLPGVGARTAPARHQTMQAAIDWSHQLLTPSEAAVFRRLAVFAGTFSLASAEAVAGSDDLQDSTPSLLGSLVDKSLVIPLRQDTTTTRYRLLEVLRQYAMDRLEESGEGPRVRNAHLRHFLELAETASPRLVSDGLEVLYSLDAERDNMRAAFLEARHRDGDRAMRLAVALFHYWSIRAHISEGREALSQALAMPTADPSKRCLALAMAAHFSWYANDWRASTAYAEGAVAIGRTIEPSVGLAIGLWALGTMSLNKLTFETALELFEQSQECAVRSGEEWVIVYPLSGFYTVRMMTGEYDSARSILMEYLRRFDGRRYPYLHCIMQCVAALLECVAGHNDAAIFHLRVGLALARTWGANYWGGWAVRTASYLAAANSDWESCWLLYGASQSLRDHTDFAVRGRSRKADDLLAPARSALDQEIIDALVEAGRSMSGAAAFDLAEIVIDGSDC